MDVAGGVTLLLDFGEAVHGSVLALDFEFAPSALQRKRPAKGRRGARYLQLIQTSSNMFGSRWIKLNGRKLFGVRSARVMADSWEKRRRQG